MIYLGTSGFSYNDWVGPFYPPGMPKREWLRYYAREFNSCEINATFYTVPKPSTLVSMANKTSDDFLFVIKANQRMTHEQKDNEAVFRAFREMVAPLAEREKMGCVLAQFPYSFRFNRKNRDYLEIFKERLADMPIVIEFRNAHWLTQEIFDWLSRNELGFCCVDEPQLPDLLPPIAVATSKVAYVRFHGRNAEKWWNHEQAYERYDYSYSPDELTDWLAKIRELDQGAERTFVFANNHFQHKSVVTMRTLCKMLRDEYPDISISTPSPKDVLQTTSRQPRRPNRKQGGMSGAPRLV